MKFFNFRRSAFGIEVFCYGLGCVGFLADRKDVNNKFNRASALLRVTKQGGKEINIILGDYVNVSVFHDYIKRFHFSTPFDCSFFSAMYGKKRKFLAGYSLC